MKLKISKSSIFFLPAFIWVFLFILFPMLWSLYVSMCRYNPAVYGPKMTFNWGLNYYYVLTDKRFWESMLHQLHYTGVSVAVEVTLGVLIALAIYNYIRSGWLKMLCLIIVTVPIMAAPIIVGTLWRLLFDPHSGVFSAISVMLGFGPIDWFDRAHAMTSLIIADIWEWTGLVTLIVYAARMAIPARIYELARVDGAPDFVVFRRITLPLLAQPIGMATLLRIMDSYRFFDLMFIMTRGGPGTATELPTFYTFILAFEQSDFGKAAALSWILGLIAVFIMQYIWNYFKKVRKFEVTI